MQEYMQERPLEGRHIAITRPEDQAPEFARRLEEAGARVSVISAIRIEPLQDTSRLDKALHDLAGNDWIVLTSVNGVRALADRLAARGLSWNRRGLARIAVIGPATAEALREQGIEPDLMPDEYVAEAIVEALGNVAGQRILLLRADIARQTLAQELQLRGAEVHEVAAYRTVEQPVDAKALEAVLDVDRCDAITFTSSSTVRGFVAGLVALGRDPEQTLAGVALAAIGPITAATLREHGLEPAILADEYTIPGLLRALIAHFASSASPTPATSPEGV